jgi:hypothetical protein
MFSFRDATVKNLSEVIRKNNYADRFNFFYYIKGSSGVSYRSLFLGYTLPLRSGRCGGDNKSPQHTWLLLNQFRFILLLVFPDGPVMSKCEV